MKLGVYCRGAGKQNEPKAKSVKFTVDVKTKRWDGVGLSSFPSSGVCSLASARHRQLRRVGVKKQATPLIK